MRRLAVVLLLSVVSGSAFGQDPASCPGCKTQCLPIPPERPVFCPCPPCEHRLALTVFSADHTDHLIATATAGEWCERLRAVKKLGSRLHADFCCNPAVLEALIADLQCDTCWEVRRAAAWSILGQKAYTTEALLALYISSKLDPHYQVRFRSAEALDILTVGYPSCYKPLWEQGDRLVKDLKAKKYVPGTANCRVLFDQACAGCGLRSEPPATEPAQPAPATEPEPQGPVQKLPRPETPSEPRTPKGKPTR